MPIHTSHVTLRVLCSSLVEGLALQRGSGNYRSLRDHSVALLRRLKLGVKLSMGWVVWAVVSFPPGVALDWGLWPEMRDKLETRGFRKMGPEVGEAKQVRNQVRSRGPAGEDAPCKAISSSLVHFFSAPPNLR